MGISEDRRKIDRARRARLASEDVRAVLEQLRGDEDSKASLAGPDGDRVVTLPRAALESLVEILESLGDGNQPSVVPMAKELSTGDVASLLGVSRQYTVRLLDDGRLPYRRVGNRRRVQLSDALAYLREDNRRRVESLREAANALLS